MRMRAVLTHACMLPRRMGAGGPSARAAGPSEQKEPPKAKAPITLKANKGFLAGVPAKNKLPNSQATANKKAKTGERGMYTMQEQLPGRASSALIRQALLLTMPEICFWSPFLL